MTHRDEYYDSMVTVLELMKGDLYETLVESPGKHDADYFVENWRAMVVVCESGEMRQGYCRGRWSAN